MIFYFSLNGPLGVVSKPRMRICFDPDTEIPRLQKWFTENNHPSRKQVSTGSQPCNKFKQFWPSFHFQASSTLPQTFCMFTVATKNRQLLCCQIILLTPRMDITGVLLRLAVRALSSFISVMGIQITQHSDFSLQSRGGHRDLEKNWECLLFTTVNWFSLHQMRVVQHQYSF